MVWPYGYDQQLGNTLYGELNMMGEAELADRQVFIQYSQNINGEIELEDTLFASYQRIGLKGIRLCRLDLYNHP